MSGIDRRDFETLRDQVFRITILLGRTSFGEAPIIAIVLTDRKMPTMKLSE